VDEQPACSWHVLPLEQSGASRYDRRFKYTIVMGEIGIAFGDGIKNDIQGQVAQGAMTGTFIPQTCLTLFKVGLGPGGQHYRLARSALVRWKHLQHRFPDDPSSEQPILFGKHLGWWFGDLLCRKPSHRRS